MIKALVIGVCWLGIVLFSASAPLFIRPTAGFCSFGQQEYKPSETELQDVCRGKYDAGIQTTCYGCVSALASIGSFSSDVGMGEQLDMIASRFSPVCSVLDVQPAMQTPPAHSVCVGQDEKRRSSEVL